MNSPLSQNFVNLVSKRFQESFFKQLFFFFFLDAILNNIKFELFLCVLRFTLQD